MILLLLALATSDNPTRRAREVATSLPFAHNAYLELRREAAAIPDPALRAAVEVQMTVVVAPNGKDHGDFLAAPGGPCETGHHGYPGGLSVHSLANLLNARAIAQTYRHIYGVEVHMEWLTAAAIWHDSMKAVTLPWREDGSCGSEKQLAGTPEHHVLGLASAFQRHLPRELIYVIAAAHGVEHACEWMQAAAKLAGIDEKVGCPSKMPIEGFITAQSDSDYPLTGLAWTRYVAKAPKGWERFDALKADGNDVSLFSRSP
jgi:hypothetical protein